MSSNIAKSARFLSVAGLLVTTLLIPFNIVDIVKASVAPFSNPSQEDYSAVSAILFCRSQKFHILMVVAVDRILVTVD